MFGKLGFDSKSRDTLQIHGLSRRVTSRQSTNRGITKSKHGAPSTCAQPQMADGGEHGAPPTLHQAPYGRGCEIDKSRSFFFIFGFIHPFRPLGSFLHPSPLPQSSAEAFAEGELSFEIGRVGIGRRGSRANVSNSNELDRRVKKGDGNPKS